MGKKSKNLLRDPRTNNKYIEVLSSYVKLVNLEIRDGYLVDNTPLSQNDIINICNTNNSNIIDKLNPISILKLGDDFVIINNEILRRKVTLFDNWKDSNPFIIDVNNEIPIECNKPQIDQITKLLKDILIPVLNQIELSKVKFGIDTNSISVINLDITELFLQTVGLPFLAGWLLGYPCIYLSTHSFNCLSLQPLIKISIYLSSSPQNHNYKSSGDGFFVEPNICFNNSQSQSTYLTPALLSSLSTTAPSSAVTLPLLPPDSEADIQIFTIPKSLLLLCTSHDSNGGIDNNLQTELSDNLSLINLLSTGTQQIEMDVGDAEISYCHSNISLLKKWVINRKQYLESRLSIISLSPSSSSRSLYQITIRIEECCHSSINL